MSTNRPAPRVIRFGSFELDLEACELRKSGLRLKFAGQPFQVLAILLENPGQVVTREQLQQRLWPDTFVDVDHSLNTAINKIREVLGDSAENPRFIETIPRRGYRFLATMNAPSIAGGLNDSLETPPLPPIPAPSRAYNRIAVIAISLVAITTLSAFLFFEHRTHAIFMPHALTRVTFDDGLQIGATWSPDSRFIAYSSDRGGKFDVWVRLVSGGDAVQITKGPGHNWQPDWSPDGKSIVYRSEDGGGLFVIPALGGEGQAKKIASFGYYPRWSPDGSQVLFRTHLSPLGITNRFFVVEVNGGQPREILADLLARHNLSADAAAWHPDGKRVSLMCHDPGGTFTLWTQALSDGTELQSRFMPEVIKQFAEASSGTGAVEFTSAAKISWSSSGDAIYFDRIYRGARNLWKLTMDPATLAAVAAERLTTAAGPDSQPAISSDGKKLAFTTQNRLVRAWLFPFDASAGKVTGRGKAITSSGIAAWLPNLSRDGSKLAYSAAYGDKIDLRQKILPDGPETTLLADPNFGGFAIWSPDAARLLYRVFIPEQVSPAPPNSLKGGRLKLWSSATREEQLLGPLVKPSLDLEPYDWAPDGKSALVSIGSVTPRDGNSTSRTTDIWRIPIGAESSEQTNLPGQRLFSLADYGLYQEHFSPDGRWIVFVACHNSVSFECTLFAAPAQGGSWTNLSEGHFMDDKPRWSPDGKMIYYVSGRAGVYNVRGLRFDPVRGRAVGASFPVTSFASPGPIIANNITAVELTLNQKSLVIVLEESPGNIWMLDNVDR
jgi:Tol biopolymer transport system component/DNA-binding winged helix-turn-helix (wHTH) protein